MGSQDGRALGGLEAEDSVGNALVSTKFRKLVQHPVAGRVEHLGRLDREIFLSQDDRDRFERLGFGTGPQFQPIRVALGDRRLPLG